MKRLFLGILLLSVALFPQSGSDEPLAVGFSIRPYAPRVGTPVQFTDYSKGPIISWLWEFGDGTTSAARNPVHTYTATGDYVMSLTISDGTNSVSMTLKGGARP